MGDYTKKGEKIGTCGNAYYATLPMLQKLAKDSGEIEANHYIKPENKCGFAFPFPEYDNKNVGEISNIHEGQRVEFTFNVPLEIETFHKKIVHHVHPKGGQGINLFIPCPCCEESKKSNNWNGEQIFRLTRQVYRDGKLMVIADCVYCEESNIFSKDEAIEIVNCLFEKATKYESLAKKDEYYLGKGEYIRLIAQRIMQTYEND